MKRREIIKSIGLLSPLALTSGLSVAKLNGTNSWLNEFTERWKVSELYNLEIFDAMPEKYLNYKPTPEVMSFGKQFSHIAKSISGYASVIRKDDPISEPDDIDKQIILRYMEDTSAEFQAMMQNLTDADLYSNDHKHKEDEVWGKLSIADILLLAYHHTAHHRGQVIVYLRINGIEPPYYRF